MECFCLHTLRKVASTSTCTKMSTLFGTHLSDKFATALSMAIQPCVCYKLDG